MVEIALSLAASTGTLSKDRLMVSNQVVPGGKADMVADVRDKQMQLVSRNTRYENREEAWPCGDRTSDLLHRQLPTGANQRPHCASTAQTVQTRQTPSNRAA